MTEYYVFVQQMILDAMPEEKMIVKQDAQRQNV
jgi:hypothetical protein